MFAGSFAGLFHYQQVLLLCLVSLLCLGHCLLIYADHSMLAATTLGDTSEDSSRIFASTTRFVNHQCPSCPKTYSLCY